MYHNLESFGEGGQEKGIISKAFSFFCTLVLNKEVLYVICDEVILSLLWKIEYFCGVSVRFK